MRRSAKTHFAAIIRLLGKPEIWKRFYEEHLAMTAAIRDRDVEALRKVFRSHNQPIETVTADAGPDD